MVYAEEVWNALHGLISTAPTGGLNSDAVIEVMLAILGCMIGVLAIVAGLVALVFAGLGVFGFQVIKDEVVKAVKGQAKEIAEETFRREFDRLNAIDSEIASGSSEDKPETPPQPAPSKGRKVSDSTLSKGKKQ